MGTRWAANTGIPFSNTLCLIPFLSDAPWYQILVLPFPLEHGNPDQPDRNPVPRALILCDRVSCNERIAKQGVHSEFRTRSSVFVQDIVRQKDRIITEGDATTPRERVPSEAFPSSCAYFSLVSIHHSR